ncbi:DUF3343 domain-containing protein [Methanococcus voltae]|uniref:DUF3343 domain-containing protein n=1 Tax=Methanococcus voltae TaxID=2188 RepID=UPI001AE849A5|nr:DUF3343 domain-containing protein [Methanococcus voltae]MBP2172178.1 hypothetical protein [Methanococcus voltae]
MILKKLKNIVSKSESKDNKDDNSENKKSEKLSGKGLLIFKNVKDTINSEKILKKKNYEIKVVAPPAEVREGCDLALQYEIIENIEIIRELKNNGIEVVKSISLEETMLQPIELVKIKKIGDHTMYRSGNMKITLDKNGIISNISGGGCPDVPYLTINLMNKHISNIPENEYPKELGYSLCAYTLHKAFEKAKNHKKN